MGRRGSPRDWRVVLVLLSGVAGPGIAEGRGPGPPSRPPGEGYPRVGPRQKLSILRDVAAATARQAAVRPLAAAGQVVGRTAERLGERARELVARRPGGGPRPPSPADPGPAGVDGGPGGGPPTPARLTLLPGSEGAIRGLLGAIGSARHRVDLMIYGWEDDPTGREVADALASRARAGVRIRLLVDRAAHLIHNPPAARGEATFLDRLAAVPGVRLILAPDANLRFDHRKLALVDDRVAWSGGMILTEVARRDWQNLAYLAEGPVVAQFAGVFAERWRELGGDPAGPAPGAFRLAEVMPNARVRLVRTDVDGQRSLKGAIYHAVDAARHRIYLANPYFSDEVLAEKLVAARARGVDVRAILTLRGNVREQNESEALTANRLLRGGVRVYLYPAMTHLKAMSVDGSWAYLGTGNFDELSLRNNREVGLAVTSPGVVRDLDRDLFLPDMAASTEPTGPLPEPKDRLLLRFLSPWL